MLHYNPTPVQEIRNEALETAGVRLLIKREDLNHPFVSGNKWWKLKYNLQEAKLQGSKTVLTFGGAFSNHIYATAAAAHELGLESIGIIRGEEVLPLNPTLQFAVEKGMKLQYISRDSYRKKNTPEIREQLHDRWKDFFLIPEGGTNALAIKGCEEFAQTLSPLSFDYLCLPVGTGGTIAGLVNGLKSGIKILGFSSLKDSDFLTPEISAWSGNLPEKNWTIVSNYHFGGYAKKNQELLQFIEEIEKQHSIPLDHVYTGKMMFGIFDLIRNNYFPRDSIILCIHTGGLQGRIKGS